MYKEIFKFFLGVAVILAIVAGVLKAFFVDLVVINDDRMAPTMLAGEQVLLWRGSDPEYGRVVVCAHPAVAGQLVIGRIVARAGMEVSVGRDALAINGRPPDRDWRGTFTFDDPELTRPVNMRWGIEELTGVEHEFMAREDYRMNFRTVRVGGGKLYLMSDYRSMTGHDSRSFGVVDASTCIGHVFMRWKPAEGRSGEPPLDHGYLDILD